MNLKTIQGGLRMKMKRLGTYFVVAMLMVSFVFVGIGIQVYAATVGEQLLEPEDGWRRYDDENDLIQYSSGWTTESVSGNYQLSNHLAWGVSYQYYTFKFVGTKFRLITGLNNDHAKNIEITIDGGTPTTYSEYDSTLTRSVLGFEKTGLKYGVHTVKVQKMDTENRVMALDAIDIDETGELLDINTPTLVTNLTATAGNKEVKLSWDKVEGAEKYVVKRSTTKGGKYKEIGETKETSYTDSGLENGTTYYYVVCAIKSGVTSPDSKEASATPQKSSSGGGSGDRAILRITMVNGKINEYDLSMDDVNDFIDWYEDSIDDKDDPYYTIEKDYNIGPFESKKDYIVADKILQFEVMEYED
jgi:hypothetical protein